MYIREPRTNSLPIEISKAIVSRDKHLESDIPRSLSVSRELTLPIHRISKSVSENKHQG